MPDQMPPPGPERDAEIARLLGVEPVRRAIATEDGTSSALTEDDPMGHGLGGFKITADDVRDFCRKHPRYHVGAWEFWPRYSTAPAAADRLVEEMVRRGWWVTVESQPNGKIFASVHRGYDYDVMIDAQTANGTTRPDAVSAAALLALRGGA